MFRALIVAYRLQIYNISSYHAIFEIDFFDCRQEILWNGNEGRAKLANNL